jgi:hypothetical protein
VRAFAVHLTVLSRKPPLTMLILAPSMGHSPGLAVPVMQGSQAIHMPEGPACFVPACFVPA